LNLLQCPQADLPVAREKARVLHDLINEFFAEPGQPGR
jgi:hypothetical protein